jgi:nucleoside-diphosphate-sugar epimerase
MAKRVKFTIDGSSRIQDFCKKTLIEAGYELSDTDADFVLAASNLELSSRTPQLKHKPCIFLSSGEVYSCLDSNLKITNRLFNESDVLIIPSTSNSYCKSLYIFQEAQARQEYPDHAVLRVFDIYGPSMDGIVTSMINCAVKGKPLEARHSVHCTISSLFEDDFKDAFLAFIKIFVEQEVRGLYNLGSDMSITIRHLADTIHQTWHGALDKADIQVVESISDFVNFHHVPNTLRFKALTSWRHKTSLRKGIWLTIQELKNRI